MSRDVRARGPATLAIATALGIAAFWIAFFTIGLAPQGAPACYLAFERAFPLPDAALAAALLAAGISLRRGRPQGYALGLAAAGGLVFLGLLDASFNLQQGIYALSSGDLLTNAAINLWCVGLGLWLIARLGRALVDPTAATRSPARPRDTSS